MSSAETTIRYDGPAFARRTINVEDIARALLAISDLCKRANQVGNGDRASVALFMNLESGQPRAEFKLEIVQRVATQASLLFIDQKVFTAKEIFEWLGLIGDAEGTVGGLFAVLKWLKGRKPDSASTVLRDGRDMIKITAGRDGIFTFPQTARLLCDPVAVHQAKEVVRPAGREGYEFVEFEHAGKVIERVTSTNVVQIEEAAPLEEKPTVTVLPQSYVRAAVRIRKAVYEGTGKWTVQYDRAIDVAIADEDWLADFQANRVAAPPGSLLDVEMLVSEIPLDASGNPLEEPTYTITKVRRIDQPPSGTGMSL
jgi:hypothetical protein